MPHQPEHNPNTPPTPVSRELIEQALGLWRDATHQVEQHSWQPGWQEDYAQAITAGLTFLTRYTTMPELVRSYFDDVTNADGSNPFEQAVHALPSRRILNYGLVEDASYFRRAQQLIAEQTGTAREARQEHTGLTEPVDVDPFALADLELAPLSPEARDELRRRMFAGEEVYAYQSAGTSGRWVVWLTDEPGRVHIDVWEAIVEYWQTRAQLRREMNHAELVATYGLQGPPAQRTAAARLGALATLRAEHPDHARQIVLYAYHEADGYLQALSPDNDVE